MKARSLIYAALLALLPVMAQAQASQSAPPPALLVIEQERLLEDSNFGKRILAEERVQAQALLEEGRRLDAELEAEERELTERRPSMDPDEFRVLANAFDSKVVRIRREQEEASREASQQADTRRRDFFRLRVAPLLLTVMSETGAGAVVEQRFVLIANQSLNITDEVIKRLDAAFEAERDAVPDPEN